MPAIEGSSAPSTIIYTLMKDEIARIQYCDMRSSEQLREQATKFITEFSPSPLSTFDFGSDSAVSVRLDSLMFALLDKAKDCGGVEGMRYVAAAVVACAEPRAESQESGATTRFESLRALGVTWLTHLLFPFMVGRGRQNQPPRRATTSSWISGTGTETDETDGLISSKEKLFLRDGFECVITGFLDFSHPHKDKEACHSRLDAAYILPRVLAGFDIDEESESYESTVLTLSLLKSFARLPDNTISDLARRVEHQSNMMTLEKNTHYTFTECRWWLKPAERNEVYRLTFFEAPGLIGRLRSHKPDFSVEFRDRSAEFLDPATSSNPCSNNGKLEFAVPDPHAIAIHATVCEVLRASGAWTFFDKVLRRYYDDNFEETSRDGIPIPVRCWPEFERLVEIKVLREVLVASMGCGQPSQDDA